MSRIVSRGVGAGAHAFVLLCILVGFILQDFVAIELQILGRDRIVATGVARLDRGRLPMDLGDRRNVAMRMRVGAQTVVGAGILVRVVIQDHVSVEVMILLGGWAVATGVSHGRCRSVGLLGVLSLEDLWGRCSIEKCILNCARV